MRPMTKSILKLNVASGDRWELASSQGVATLPAPEVTFFFEV